MAGTDENDGWGEDGEIIIPPSEPKEEETTPEEGEKEPETEETEATEPEEGEEAPSEEETEEKTPEEEPEKAEVTLRVDGKDVPKTVEEVIQIAQKNLAADVRLEQASLAKKEAEEAKQELSTAQEDIKAQYERIQQINENFMKFPLEVLDDLLQAQAGGRPQEDIFMDMYNYLKPRYEFMDALVKDPEKMKQHLVASENERLKNQDKMRQEQEQAAAVAKTQQEHFDAVSSGIDEALVGQGFEKDDEVKFKVTQLILAAGEAGEDLTPAEAVDRLSDEIRAKQARTREELLEGLQPEELEKLNPELTKKFQSYSVKKVKARQQKAQAKKKPSSATKKTKPKVTTWEDKFGDPWDQT